MAVLPTPRPLLHVQVGTSLTSANVTPSVRQHPSALESLLTSDRLLDLSSSSQGGVTSSCSLGPSPNMTDCQELAETISHYSQYFVGCRVPSLRISALNLVFPATSWVDGKGGGTGSGLRTCHFWIRNQSPYTLEMCFKVMAASAFALMGSCDSFKKPGVLKMPCRANAWVG
ncbi:hypothetical protein BXZ70DRAFT_651385 [Cristinia sonorae]|uniref:Uncharacterized protein n=1 Tax=Cristinia sonorae TaxID=1940300 RepID=A0A8K0UDP1_9AGAR|nr:hypothetical protein BXZ70DRAFT_651385 [Cristinia sonorae]